MESGIVDSNGIRIAYERRGSGPVLLAIMGLGGQLTDWPPALIDLLARDFTVITFDNRDQGLSTEFTSTPPKWTGMLKARITGKAPESEYQLTDMAADAAGLLDALGISQVHLMGMSMGGMIAQTFAIEHAHRVLSLTSIMSNTGDNKNGTIDPRVMVKMMRMPEPSRDEAADFSVEQFRLFAGSAWDPAEHRRRSVASVERSWRPQGTERQLAAIVASPDRTAALHGVRVPTLVVHGLADKLVRPSGGIATANAIPGSRLLMFPDMGHDLPATRHVEIAEAVVRIANPAGVASQPVAV